MDNLLSLALEAHNDELNHHRRYEIEIGKDLFDQWTLSIRYGRVGSGRQEKHFAAKDEREIKRLIRERLRRRLTSHSRIACDYRVVAFEKASDVTTNTWLPSGLVSKLI